ncbi:MAG TPA: hypothetical protein VFU02_13995 [Polyangiaceae bacterium]|nr:hypothetical protein [Polyangiaceae bacterium]
MLLGLLLAACGGESTTSNSEDSNSGNGSGGTSSTSSTGSSSSTDCSGRSEVVPPGCFGSPGPVTSGSTTGVGTGGAASGSSDTTSASAGGSGGLGGAGGSAGGACEAQDVAGEGACGAAFGVFFLGDRCFWVSGCTCEGDDCENPYEDEASCERAHRGCLDGCAAQDITLIGGCDPAGVWVFNGIECVAMEGCSCIGDDCDASYPSREACEAAHAVCAERPRSCDEIAAAYGEYVAHTACHDDNDCEVAVGLCAAGHGCAHVVNRRWGQAGIAAFTQQWDAAGCPQLDCDCAAPAGALCEEGVCVPAE